MQSRVKCTSGRASAVALRAPALSAARLRHSTPAAREYVQVQAAKSTLGPEPTNPVPHRTPETSPAGARTINPDAGAQYFTREDSRPVILFDGSCNLCNAGVNFMLDFDKYGKFRLSALQSEAGKQLLMRSGRKPDDISSIALVTQDRHWVKSQAVLNIAKRMEQPWAAAAHSANFFHESIRNAVYDFVAENRYKMFGESESCRLMRPEWKSRFLTE